MLFPDQDENTQYVNRTDVNEVLGSFSTYPFRLEGFEWQSVEHYFQGMKFLESDPLYAEKIRMEPDAKKAQKLGRKNSRQLRSDWAKVKHVVMTRAVYTQCKTHQEVKQALLDTGDSRLLNNQQYDYYWGCGRDRRGENHYGLVLMEVRQKLLEEAKAE